jgi:hypothetical protein
MSELRKARLGEIGSGDGPQEGRNWVDVQFNPSSLRVQISNRTAGGQQAGAQARQRPGTGEMQVTFDLVFDTADEGDTDAPVDVLKRTAAVERFVRPRGTQPGQEAPPRVAFEWGSFQVQGVMESANIDLDFFDASGVPLRAKVSVTIKGQDPKWAYEPDPRLAGGNAAPAASAGGRPGGAAGLQAPPGGAGGLPAGAPGTQGAKGPAQQLLAALPGESLAQLSARAGVAPGAWRALAQGGLAATGSQGLALGQEVAVPAGLASGSGGGLATGRQSAGRDPARAAAGLPLTATSPSQRGSQPGMSPAAAVGGEQAVMQGQAMTALGGVGEAIAQRHDARHQRGAADSLRAFGQAPGATEGAADRPWGAGVPLRPRLGQADLDAMGRRTARGARPQSGAMNAGTASAPSASSASALSGRMSTAPRPLAGKAARSPAPGCGCRGRDRGGSRSR